MVPPRGSRVLVGFSLVLLCACLALLGKPEPGDEPSPKPRRPAAARPPGQLQLQWVRDYPPLKPAWPDQPRLQFDAAYQPVVHGRSLFVVSSRTDSVTALDRDTGEEQWRFFADGPVRFAPTAWEGRLYVA